MGPDVAKAVVGWARVVEAHLGVVRKTATPAQIEMLEKLSGLHITPLGNSASSHGDVLRYLAAVEEVLGQTAWVSAKFTILSRMRREELTPQDSGEVSMAKQRWSSER